MSSTAIRDLITQHVGTHAVFNLRSQSKDAAIGTSAWAATGVWGMRTTRTPEVYYILQTAWQQYDLAPH